MTWEAELKVQTEPAIPFTCADGTAIEKGTLCRLTTPNTASKATAETERVAGISVNEKIASDGVTKIGCYRRGYFNVYVSGAAIAGDAMVFAGDNHIKVAPIVSISGAVQLSGAKIVGFMMEDATSGQKKLMELNINAQIVRAN